MIDADLICRSSLPARRPSEDMSEDFVSSKLGAKE